MKKFIVTSLIIILFLPLFTPVYAQTNRPISSQVNLGLQDKLTKYFTVEAALLGVSDGVSLSFKDLSTNTSVLLKSDRAWIPASTIKAYVVLEAYRQRRAGLINFNQHVTIAAQNVVPTELETDEFPRLREGVVVTISQLIDAMITQSDNTAYNTLLDLFDRRSINTTLKSLGITHTIVGEKLNLDDNQFQTDLEVPGRRPNTTTSGDLAKLFEILYTKSIPDTTEILSIFRRQKINSMIPALLPTSTTVAHKTGDWAPLYHDGGVVYKPGAPFILTVFTNGNDTQVIAKLAHVAYEQSSASIGEEIIPSTVSLSSPTSGNTYLALANTESVLGAQNQVTYVVLSGDSLWSIAEEKYGSGFEWTKIAAENKLTPPYNVSAGTELILPSSTTTPLIETTPTVTAADLGVTNKDVEAGASQKTKITGALLTPASILYPIKRALENILAKLAPTEAKQAGSYLSMAKNRLNEIKSVGKQGDINSLTKLVTESENDLSTAVAHGQNSANLDQVLSETNQLTQLHYAVLAEVAKNIPADKKDAFIDSVYSFYQKNEEELQPKIKRSIQADPLNQQPLVGEVSEVKKDEVTVKFTDGTTQAVVLTDTTPVRDFNATQVDQTNELTVGTKITVIKDAVSNDHKIIPRFILRNIPKEVPEKIAGIVVEIDTANKTMKIRDNGQEKNIQIDDTTVIKSKDTNASLDGITAGSKVVIAGTNDVSATPSAQPSSATYVPPNLSSVSPKSSAGSGTLKIPLPSAPTISTAPAGSSSPVHATTVTVVQNASGKTEKTVQAKQSAPSKQPKAEEPKKDSPKTDTKAEDNKTSTTEIKK